MKKFFFLYALLLLSFSSTTANTDNSPKEINPKVCSHWVEVNPGCENIFWLCTDNYDDIYELVQAAEFFSQARCD